MLLEVHGNSNYSSAFSTSAYRTEYGTYFADSYCCVLLKDSAKDSLVTIVGSRFSLVSVYAIDSNVNNSVVDS